VAYDWKTRSRVSCSDFAGFLSRRRSGPDSIAPTKCDAQRSGVVDVVRVDESQTMLSTSLCRPAPYKMEKHGLKPPPSRAQS
jgi:hypothetical protein